MGLRAGWFNPDHLLDLLITDQSFEVGNVRAVDSQSVSDHPLILVILHACSIHSTNNPVPFSFRPIRVIDLVQLKSRFNQSSLHSIPKTDRRNMMKWYRCILALVTRRHPSGCSKSLSKLMPSRSEPISHALEKRLESSSLVDGCHFMWVAGNGCP